ncbi:zinc finger CCCH domain-containing protein 5 [Impatiens glandulifera]|uniref:zinc finger CCCH domain-containing protein 5 n=1 Tax=Impatiens glandulifera TaxID=253017 RepID=UPI001FB14739|nr:zinc finger CCCH domain-containing protein 5 [Impatiens glandulifera]
MADPIQSSVVALSNDQESRQSVQEAASMSRKERRKMNKKEKRKQMRKELAEKEREEEEAQTNDPNEQRRIQLEEESEKERMERDRKEFEEAERIFLEALEAKKKAEEEELKEAIHSQVQNEDDNEDDDWEFVEDGPPEIIWQGNEIIVKKKKVKVRRKDINQPVEIKDDERPTSNPLPPQSEAFAEYKDAPLPSAEQLLEDAAQQIPNFGTEQDKAHCPFHLKTGACRFGIRCSRVHFYPDKSCTLLIKNMYNGPGLAWEQDEGLECTDEEIEHSYEEFYEDVHTEFLKCGEIINFKACRNGSSHLKGNVYVHYKSQDSALLAFQSLNGRYFAGKQVKCEFVAVSKWKVAICGEYMKSRLRSCSHGSACNFIHCFRNPGGDYEWADWDRPPPRYWVKKMAALFGESAYEQDFSNTHNETKANAERYRFHQSWDRGHLGGNSSQRQYLEHEGSCSSRRQYFEHEDIRSSSSSSRRHRETIKSSSQNKKGWDNEDDLGESEGNRYSRKRRRMLDTTPESDSDGDRSDGGTTGVVGDCSRRRRRRSSSREEDEDTPPERRRHVSKQSRHSSSENVIELKGVNKQHRSSKGDLAVIDEREGSKKSERYYKKSTSSRREKVTKDKISRQGHHNSFEIINGHGGKDDGRNKWHDDDDIHKRGRWDP